MAALWLVLSSMTTLGWQLFTAASGPGPVALTAVALAGLLGGLVVWYSRVGRDLASASNRRPWVLLLRDRAARTTYLRLSDPDAAGRPRPRAPGARSVIA